jgi:histidyl-tRNA synthetase
MSKQPKQLLQKQEMQRQKTVNLIIRAISELKVEGYSIKINHLMEMTGLSRSVFSKPHVREILQNNGIGYAKTNMQIQTPAKLQSKAIADYEFERETCPKGRIYFKFNSRKCSIEKRMRIASRASVFTDAKASNGRENLTKKLTRLNIPVQSCFFALKSKRKVGKLYVSYTSCSSNITTIV